MEFVRYEVKDAIGIITMDRPKTLNALNSQVLAEINEVLDQVDQDAVRVLIITGAGEKSFVAGADIGEMVHLSPEEASAFSKKGNDTFLRIEKYPLPIIAAINGYALGGGCELALACDIRICSENAVFGLIENSMGITPGFGGTQRMARQIGIHNAKMLIYTACKIPSSEAFRIGLVDRVYPREELMDNAMRVAHMIAQNAPIAVRNSKIAINKGYQMEIGDGVEVEEKYFGSCFGTEDQRAAMENFLEKDKSKKLKVVPFKNR